MMIAVVMTTRCSSNISGIDSSSNNATKAAAAPLFQHPGGRQWGAILGNRSVTVESPRAHDKLMYGRERVGAPVSLPTKTSPAQRGLRHKPAGHQQKPCFQSHPMATPSSAKTCCASGK